MGHSNRDAWRWPSLGLITSPANRSGIACVPPAEATAGANQASTRFALVAAQRYSAATSAAPRTVATIMRLRFAHASGDGQRLAGTGGDDQAGQRHVEQAFADDKAGHDQHAHALGRFAPACALPPRVRRSQPATAPTTTGSGDRARQVDGQAHAQRRQAVFAVAGLLQREVDQHQDQADQRAVAEQVPGQVAADHALGQRRDQGRLRRRQRGRGDRLAGWARRQSRWRD